MPQKSAPSALLAQNLAQLSVAVPSKTIAVLKGHTKWVYALAILPNGHIVSGSWDKSLRIWDSATGECITVLKGHTDGVRALAILPNGHIVSGSRDKSLRIWS